MILERHDLPVRLFPLSILSTRTRNGLLELFSGKHPTVEQALSIPLHEYQAMPGIGPKSIRELEGVLADLRARHSVEPFTPEEETVLLARLEKLVAEFAAVANEIRRRIGEKGRATWSQYPRQRTQPTQSFREGAQL
jgi:hypothetical protein